MCNKHTAEKIMYISFFIFIFLRVFIVSDFQRFDWYTKFNVIGVPAFSYPGIDSRNIQNAAYCSTKGYSYFSYDKCQDKNIELKKIYPESTGISSYNYPPLWADIYKLFDNYTEDFYLFFWKFNAIVLIMTILIYSNYYNYKLFPLVAFSPVALLTVERGNIEAIVFGVIFLPLILSNSKIVHSFFLGLAGALKIYPIVGFIHYIKDKLNDLKKVLSGSVLITPLIIYSLLYLPEYIKNTPSGTSCAFGLFSLKNLSCFKNNSILFYSFIFSYIIYCILLICCIIKNKSIINEVKIDFSKMKQKSIHQLSIALIMYVILFLVFTSWAYRFIILIPVTLILANHKNNLSYYAYWLILITIWIPIFPYGWYFFNYLCYILTPLLGIILFYAQVENCRRMQN